jgi:hypothetical protein
MARASGAAEGQRSVSLDAGEPGGGTGRPPRDSGKRFGKGLTLTRWRVTAEAAHTDADLDRHGSPGQISEGTPVVTMDTACQLTARRTAGRGGGQHRRDGQVVGAEAIEFCINNKTLLTVEKAVQKPG